MIRTDQDINFRLNLVDDISATLGRIEQSTGELDKKVERLTQSTQEQNVSFIAQVQAVRSVDTGLRGIATVTGEVIGQTNLLTRGLQATSVAVHGVSSAFQLAKGARQAIIMLRSAEMSLGVVESFRAGLKGKMGLVLMGVASAAAAGGYLAGRTNVDSSTTVNQNLNFGPAESPDNRALARETLIALGGY